TETIYSWQKLCQHVVAGKRFSALVSSKLHSKNQGALSVKIAAGGISAAYRNLNLRRCRPGRLHAERAGFSEAERHCTQMLIPGAKFPDGLLILDASRGEAIQFQDAC